MNARKLLVITLLAVFSISLTSQVRASGLDAQSAQDSEVVDPFDSMDPYDPEGFRHVLLKLCLILEQESDQQFRVSEAIANATYDEMAIWLSFQYELDRFLNAARSIIARHEGSTSQRIEGPATAAAGFARGSGIPPLTRGFFPDYPPNDDAYGRLLDRIRDAGIEVYNRKRCNTEDWDNYFEIWYNSYVTLGAVEGLCVVAGCDPVGFGCAAVCGIYETLATWLSLAAQPVELCAVHDGNVDGAEIEAAYQNSNLILSDLFVHDANIDADLVLHDANLAAHDANLAAHHAEISARLDGVQESLDHKVELRRVHLQVMELVNRQKYLVVTTEAGDAIDVIFEGIEVFDENAASFVSIPSASVARVEHGIYTVEFNLAPLSPGKVFRLKVMHDKAIVDHYGEIIFHRIGSKNLGSGQ